jgi:sugar phosphate permease
MSIVSGYLVQAYGWRAMFVIEGLPACLWAIGWWYLVQDRPAEASWLDPNERAALEAKMADEQQGLKAVRNYGERFVRQR